MSRPEISFRNGPCGASVFAHEVDMNGKRVTVKKAVITKSYKNRNGEWKDTNSLDVNDIPKAILVLTKAYDYMTNRRAENNHGGMR